MIKNLKKYFCDKNKLEKVIFNPTNKKTLNKEIYLNKENIKNKLDDNYMKNYEISSTEIFNKKYFSERGEDFKFENKSLKDFTMNLQVEGINKNSILLNSSLEINGPAFILKNNFYQWNVPNSKYLESKHFSFIKYRIPKIEYLLIGTGEEKTLDETHFIDLFDELDINIDILSSFEAASTFNMCSENDMNVAWFIYPY